MGKYPGWKEMIGQTYGDWEILERDYNPTSTQHSTFFKCRCIKCGEIVSVSRDTIIRNPNTQHKKCWGKARRTLDDKMIGQQFGYLTVLKRDESKNSKHTSYFCQCSCGKCNNKIISVRADHLLGQGRESHTTSCGLAKMSAGELKIESILKENNISYQTQYIIPEFNPLAKFDFAIFDKENCLVKLIEFDGQQHFEPIAHFGGEEQFVIQQQRDKAKNLYCQENNIILLRVPYYDFDKIDLDYLF